MKTVKSIIKNCRPRNWESNKGRPK